MLIYELIAKKAQLEAEMESLFEQIQPLEENLKLKREMVQHVNRMIELEGGVDEPESSTSGTPEGSVIVGERLLPRAASNPQLVPIFKYYKGQKYEAELDRSRIVGDRGQCVRFRDKWMAPSAAGISIPTKNNVNGWQF